MTSALKNSPGISRRKRQAHPKHWMLCINALRFLLVDAVEQAHSAHPGLAVGRTALAKYRRVSASITSLMLAPLDSAVHAGRVFSLLTCSNAAQGEQF